MKQNYIKPFTRIIHVDCNTSVLCASNIESVKKYGCPIQKGVDCPAYDKGINEWTKALQNLANRRSSILIYQGTDEAYCPRKSACPIYLEWQNQQKTR